MTEVAKNTVQNKDFYELAAEEEGVDSEHLNLILAETRQNSFDFDFYFRNWALNFEF